MKRILLFYSVIVSALCLSVTSLSAQYCTAEFTNTADEWIGNFDFADISNPSGSTGYSDFTAITGNIVAGMTYSPALTVTFGGGAFTEFGAVYIDYNQNGSFEATEVTFIGSCNTAGCILSGDVVVPVDACNGPTRMRVILQYNVAPDATGCVQTTFGEAEDYTVNITGGLECASGCTNPIACNYDATANNDNGTCIFPAFIELVNNTIPDPLVGYCLSDPLVSGADAFNTDPATILVPLAIIGGGTSFDLTASAGTFLNSLTPPVALPMDTVESSLIFYISLTDADIAGGAVTVNYTDRDGLGCSGSIDVDLSQIAGFTDVETFCPPPACDLFGNISAEASCRDTDNFEVLVTIDAAATGSNYSIGFVGDGGVAALTGQSAGSISIGVLPEDTDTMIYVLDPSIPGCADTITLTTVAGQCDCFGSEPANDDCMNAISLTPLVMAPTTADYVVGTNLCATDSSPLDGPGCENFGGADVWFSFTTSQDFANGGTCSGDITVSTEDFAFSTMYAEIYSGTCGALVSEGCVSDGTTNTVPTDLGTISGLNCNTTYYVRVWDWGGNDFGDFDIAIYDPNPDLGCTPPVLTYTGADDCANGGFFVEVDTTSFGSSTSIDLLENGVVVATITPTTVYPFSFGPFPIASSVTIDAVPNDDAICTVSSSPVGFVCPAACGIPYTDSGGTTAGYIADARDTITICPQNAGEIVEVTFTYVDIETTTAVAGGSNSTGCWDYLTVYNGPDVTAPSLGDYCGEENGDGGTAAGPGINLTVGTVFTSLPDDCLTFTFYSDGSAQETGWEATVSCFAPTCDINTLELTAACISPTEYAVDVSFTSSSTSHTISDGTNSTSVSGAGPFNTLTDLGWAGLTADATITVSDDSQPLGTPGCSVSGNVTLPLCDCFGIGAATIVTVADCANGQFFIEVNVTDLGTATSFDVTDGTVSLGTALLGMTQVGPFASGTVVDITLQPDDNTLCSLGLTGLTLNCPPVCGESFVDSGGAGIDDGTTDYAINENETITICPDVAGDVVQVNFTTFNLENSGNNCFDQLAIYDGMDATAPVIPPTNAASTATGWCWDLDDATPNGSGNLAGMTITSSDASGCLTFVFTSDGSSQREGFEGLVTCFTPSCDVSSLVTEPACINSTEYAVDITFSGTGSDFTISDGANTAMLTASGTYNTVTDLGWGAYNADTTITIVDNSQPAGTAGCELSGMITALDCSCFMLAPGNDLCADAIPLNVDAFSCLVPTLGNNDCASDSEETAPTCANYLGGDVWYSVTVPESGEITVETTNGGSFTDGGMSIYSGDCGSLVQVECDDDDSPDGAFSLIALTGQTFGDVLYVRVWEYGGNDSGDFNICAWDPNPVLDCTSPTVTFEIVPDCANSQFWVDVTVSDLGTATSVDINDGTTSLGTITTVMTPLQVGPFADASIVDLFGTPDDNALCQVASAGLTNTCPPGCGGTYVDSGGAGIDDGTTDYASSTADTLTICPDVAGQSIVLNFTTFNLENNTDNCYDQLEIFDGSDVTAAVIPPTNPNSTTTGWCFDQDAASEGGSGDLTGMSIASTDASGCLTLVFTSDGSVTREGFEASILCGIPGCMDMAACNYDAAATVDDGSCDLGNAACTDPCAPVMGCTDMAACNYNADACEDDGSCDSGNVACTDPCAPVMGCTDMAACNYNADACVDDGMCDLGNTDCADPCNPIVGCTDPDATNYDATACVNMGCSYTMGCTNPAACNYDAGATQDDGSCDLGNSDCTDPCAPVMGCTDMTACNYDATACVDDGTCDAGNSACTDPCAPVMGCTDAAACNYNADACVDDGSCDAGNSACTDPCAPLMGCTDATACNYNADACVDDGSCQLPDGCTDSNATNYDATALCDDGSCTFEMGCTNPTACNYDMNASQDDGSCEFGNSACTDPCAPVIGCTDAAACNFDATACIDDGSCTAPDADCGCDAVVSGCTDATACNYDAAACSDDGSCVAPDADCGCDAIVTGCTDAAACNYDAAACSDDGSCEAPDADCGCETVVTGCTDATACNYDATACSDDGSCQLPDGCTDPTAFNYDAAAICDDGSCIPVITGCIDATACNYNPAANTDDASCDFGETECPDACNAILGCTDETALNYNPDANCDNGICVPVVMGCTNASACNYDPAANVGDGSCDFGIEGCPNPCTAVLGCTSPTACNYNAMATCDDNSCDEPNGCTDMTACNFDSAATCDDGSCDYGETDCPDPCNAILGCTDVTACNYNASANCDDGGCVIGDCNPGCTDPCAPNYDMTADADDGSCMDYDQTCNTDCSVGDIEVWDGTTCGCVVTLTSVSGCTDATACNYDAAANCNDDSCDYGVLGCPDPCAAELGCTDASATNYEATATCDDGSCIATVLGCIDATACNYNENANTDDGNCDYGNTDCPDACNVILGCTNESALNYNPNANCDNGTCVDAAVGCTDATACNYEPTANTDDGSCDYGNSACSDPCTVVMGCTDMNAINFDATACVDDGSCIDPVDGCIDATACNYDANANTDDGSCDYGNSDCSDPCTVVMGCTDAAAINYDATACVDDGSCIDAVDGCTDPGACNYNSAANVDDGNCDYGDTDCPDSCNAILGCTDATAINYDAAANCDDGSCVDTINGCTDATACNYNSAANVDDGNCDYGNTDCPDACNVVMGCTDVTAINYDAAANCDDGSCIDAVDGCTDATACNYDSAANVEDGSCDYGNTDCPDPCNVVMGCTDMTACNFDSAANCDNASCEYESCATGGLETIVFFDENENGTFDGDDEPIPGATVLITGAGEDGILGTSDDTNSVASTGVNGRIGAGNLPPGDYSITVYLPAGFVFGDGSTTATYTSSVQAGVVTEFGSNGEEIPVVAPAVSCDDFEAIAEVICLDGPDYNLIISHAGGTPGSEGYLITNNLTGETLVNNFGNNTLIGPFNVGTGYDVTISVIANPDCSLSFSSQSIDCTVTSVELLSFDGKVETDFNDVYWTTASEQDADYFILEKSLDGVRFEQIGQVNTLGNSNIQQHYNYADSDVAPGIAYYRLLEVDQFGETRIVSQVISLIRDAKPFSILNVAPVPASSTVSINYQVESNSAVSLTVYDITGKLIYSSELKAQEGLNQINLDISQYSVGTYFVQMLQDGVQQTARIIKE